MPYALTESSPTLAADAYAAFCAEAAAAGLSRRLPVAPTAPRLDFSSNDYLGLARDPRIVRASARGAARFGTGAGGSRLLSGNLDVHRVLERRIARDLGAEQALVFPSGFSLNASVLATLLDGDVLGSRAQVFADKAMHASLYAACGQANIAPQRFRHNDLGHLERLLEHSDPARPRVIVSESVFSMDGDRADVAALRTLAGEYRALLYLDDAHGIGVEGPDGYGTAAGILRHGGIVMGTFSKALGGVGGYIAASAGTCAYLVQRCPGFIYATALAPPSAAAALTAWKLLPVLGAERLHVRMLAERLRAGLQRMQLDTGASSTQIVPIMMGDIARTALVKERLSARGIAVSAIRPPTVAPNAPRVRVSVTAAHRPADVDELLDALESAIK